MTKCTLHGFLENKTKECQKCKDQSNAEGAKIGKLPTRTTLVIMRKEITIFHKEYYIPMLHKYSYHFRTLKILSKKICIDRK